MSDFKGYLFFILSNICRIDGCCSCKVFPYQKRRKNDTCPPSRIYCNCTCATYKVNNKPLCSRPGGECYQALHNCLLKFQYPRVPRARVEIANYLERMQVEDRVHVKQVVKRCPLLEPETFWGFPDVEYTYPSESPPSEDTFDQ